MDALLGVITFVGHAIESVLNYIESHHWIFGLAMLGYIFYLHDRALHARFDALDTDHDGTLDKKELRGFLAAQLKR